MKSAKGYSLVITFTVAIETRDIRLSQLTALSLPPPPPEQLICMLSSPKTRIQITRLSSPLLGEVFPTGAPGWSPRTRAAVILNWKLMIKDGDEEGCSSRGFRIEMRLLAVCGAVPLPGAFLPWRTHCLWPVCYGTKHFPSTEPPLPSSSPTLTPLTPLPPRPRNTPTQRRLSAPGAFSDPSMPHAGPEDFRKGEMGGHEAGLGSWRSFLPQWQMRPLEGSYLPTRRTSTFLRHL